MNNKNLGWLLQSSGAGLQELMLLPGLLEALQAIKGADAAGVEWQDALKKLLVGLDSNAKPAGVGDDDWKMLAQAWGGLKTALQGQFPKRLRVLTFKLSDFFASSPPGGSLVENPLSYPLTASASTTGAPVVGGLTLATSAEASATATVALEVYDSAPDSIRKLGYDGPEAEYLMRLGVRGELQASAGAKATPAWGKISASASASATAFLDTYFHFPASRYVAKALLEALPQMVAPGDLSGLLQVCGQPAAVGDFAMSVTELSGTLSLGGDLGIGVSVASSFGSDLAEWGKVNGTKPATLTAELALTASFKWSVQGTYRTVARQVGKAAHVRIERIRDSTSGVSISAGAVIDVEGLQALLDPVLARVLPASEPLTSRLGKLSDLRGLALDAVAKRLGIKGTGAWDGVATQLLHLAGGATTGAAKTALADAIATRFDVLAKKRLADKSAALDHVSADIVALLETFTGPGGAWQAGVAAKVDEAVGEVDARITAAYDEFKKKVAADVAGTLATILSVPAAKLGSFFSDLQGRVDAFTNPLTTWIARYESLRKKFAKVIAQVETEKLALTWTYSYEKEREASTIVEVAFHADTPGAKALYTEMRAGRLGDYRELLAACEPGSVEQISWLDSVSQGRKVTSGLVISVFGWQTIEATLATLDKVAIGVDDTGRIISASVKELLESTLKIRRKTTKATIDLSLELFAAADAAPPLSTLYSATGEAFTLTDERNFYELLIGARAVSAGAGDRMRTLLWNGSAAADSTLKDAELSLLYQPDADAWQRLLAANPADIATKVRETGLELLHLAAVSGAERPLPGGSPRQWIADWLHETQLTEVQFWEQARQANWYDFYNKLVTLTPGNPQTVQGPATAHGASQNGIYTLWQIARMSEATGDAWKKIAHVNALFEQLRSPSPGISRDEAFAQLSRWSGDIRQDLSRVLDRVIPDWVKTTKVGWQYLTLIVTLARAGSPGGDARLLTKAKANVAGVDSTFLVT